MHTPCCLFARLHGVGFLLPGVAVMMFVDPFGTIGDWGPFTTDVRARRFEDYQAELERLQSLGHDVVRVERMPDGWRIFHQPSGGSGGEATPSW